MPSLRKYFLHRCLLDSPDLVVPAALPEAVLAKRIHLRRRPVFFWYRGLNVTGIRSLGRDEAFVAHDGHFDRCDCAGVERGHHEDFHPGVTAVVRRHRAENWEKQSQVEDEDSFLKNVMHVFW